MSSIALSGNASGAGVFTIASPNSASSFTATLPAATTTLVGTDATQTLTNKTLTSPTITGASMSSMASSVITSGTSVASTSGTSIDFTNIPSWAKRITVMFNAVSTSGISPVQIQLGTGAGPTYTTTGYLSYALYNGGTVSSTTGLVTIGVAAVDARYGQMVISNHNGNVWVESCGHAVSGNGGAGGGGISLAAALTAVRITTVNGTDTFDAGSINILYE